MPISPHTLTRSQLCTHCVHVCGDDISSRPPHQPTVTVPGLNAAQWKQDCLFSIFIRSTSATKTGLFTWPRWLVARWIGSSKRELLVPGRGRWPDGIQLLKLTRVDWLECLWDRKSCNLRATATVATLSRTEQSFSGVMWVAVIREFACVAGGGKVIS